MNDDFQYKSYILHIFIQFLVLNVRFAVKTVIDADRIGWLLFAKSEQSLQVTACWRILFFVYLRVRPQAGV